MSSILCKLIGHTFREKTLKEVGLLYNTFSLARYKYCLRCGAPNPNLKGES